jgi:hypothetical protein
MEISIIEGAIKRYVRAAAHDRALSIRRVLDNRYRSRARVVAALKEVAQTSIIQRDQETSGRRV